MIALSIDASFNAISMSFFKDNDIVYDMFVDSKETHSKAFVGLMDYALRAAALTLNDINELYCSIGPGNYTSLRVLVATIKGLFFQKNVNVHTVNTFDLIAAGYHDKVSKFTVVSPVFAHQVKCSNYIHNNGIIERDSEIYIKNESEITQQEGIKISPVESDYADKVLPLSKNVLRINKRFIKKAELGMLSPIY